MPDRRRLLPHPRRGRRRRQLHAHRPRGDLRPGGLRSSRSTTRPTRSASPTTATTACRARCGPAAPPGPSASPRRCAPACCRSTPTAVVRYRGARSAATSGRASAASSAWHAHGPLHRGQERLLLGRGVTHAPRAARRCRRTATGNTSSVGRVSRGRRGPGRVELAEEEGAALLLVASRRCGRRRPARPCSARRKPRFSACGPADVAAPPPAVAPQPVEAAVVADPEGGVGLDVVASRARPAGPSRRGSAASGPRPPTRPRRAARARARPGRRRARRAPRPARGRGRCAAGRWG